ncbi:hypothetical protein H257_15501 [Aphanomyces astaci]|uniref:PX domain-containing protein n=1 Tax=Aphanomyces astaci TaxID=112090 RepID=W4FLZ8_APHAT|nr:hypothetical protein H257_15501 [Aphanomyces astaci]ETV68500.1 hypothetical protein H257_15501 [Aphanomyces astaci]|eukprot:XP_009841929.1 hypothetical protein H257_15501 [Aphanomyces astaci]
MPPLSYQSSSSSQQQQQHQIQCMKTSITGVSSPAGPGAHSPTQYTIRVADQRSNTTQWLVHKRYSDFRSFRSSLLDPSTTLCGSCVELADEAPVAHGFPKRKWIFSNTKRVIMERQEGLAVFLDRVNVSVRNCHHPDCMSRPLLEKFLMLADMRYTFIDMQLHDNTDESTAAPTRPAAITFIPPPSSLRHSFADTLGSRRSDVPDLLRHSFHGTQVRHRRHSVHVSSADRIKKFRELAPIKVAPKADKKRMSLETIEEVAE